MGFSEFLGNEAMVAALRGALRAERVPHAMLFTGPRGVGKFTLARMFAQAANCERLKDDFCGECPTCQRIGQLANLNDLIAEGLAERGESADAATVERVPLILQSHPDVWVMDPKVQFIDDTKPLLDTQLDRVRGVSGVEWAVPLFCSQPTAATNEKHSAPVMRHFIVRSSSARPEAELSASQDVASEGELRRRRARATSRLSTAVTPGSRGG